MKQHVYYDEIYLISKEFLFFQINFNIPHIDNNLI